MPKLSARDRKKVDAAEAVEERNFEPLPAGKYLATLKEVEVRTGKDSGNEYWNCTFDNIRDLEGEDKPGSLWYRLMLPIAKRPADYRPKSGKPKKDESEEQWIERSWNNYQEMTAGRIKAFFEAFGFSLDSDTEEMYGDEVALSVGISTIGQGPRKGERTNEVRAVISKNEIDLEVDDDADDDSDF